MSPSQMSPASSPPATPGRAPPRPNGAFSFLPDHPSTTPAGAPPPSVFSTTPAGPPPPSATFGSSNLGTNLFSTRTTAPASSKGIPSKLFKTSPNTSFGSHRGLGKVANGRPSKPAFLGAHRAVIAESGSEYDDEDDENAAGADEQREHYENEDEDEDGDDYDEDEDESYTQEDADEDAEGETEEDDYESEPSQTEDEIQDDASGDESDHSDRDSTPQPSAPSRLPKFGGSTASAGDFDWAGLANEIAPPSVSEGSTHGMKRSRGISASLIDSIEADLPPAKRRESALPRIAQDLAKTVGTAALHDPDGLVIGTEEILSVLVRKAKAPTMAMGHQERLSKALEETPRDLLRLWKTQVSKLDLEDVSMDAGIGPSEDSDGATKATFLARLLLSLHHPSSSPDQGYAQTSTQQSLSRSTQLMRLDERNGPSYPRILLDFINSEHYSIEQPIKALYGHQPNPVANPKFWDTLVAGVARGFLDLVHKILHFSDFRYSWRPAGEGRSQTGYAGTELDRIHAAVGAFTNILSACPAIRDDDWEISGSAWALFRKRCADGLVELTAAGKSRHANPLKVGLEASSGLPERVYSNLRIMYGILLGKSAEIMSVSLDWLDATIGLTVWWNGEDDAIAGGLKASRRSNIGRVAPSRLVDVNPGAAYRARLSEAVDMVTNGPDDDALMVNTSNPVEVALASVFEGNIEGAVGILQTWSLPVTSAVLELAKWAGWYETPPSNSRPEGFDDSDLMVLSYAKPEHRLTKDDVNLAYSDYLFEKADFKAGKLVKEGWELAVNASYRLDNPQAAQKRMAWLIDRVPIETEVRADKIAVVCHSLGFVAEAHKACESFADHISTTSHNYGTALIYYARAHASKKCKDVLDLLISMCLVRSTAYPPLSPDESSRGVDSHLAALIASPQESIQHLASIDTEAADILSEYITGYATLRRFYELRDQGMVPTSSQQRSLRPRARLRAAAKSLLACISSAGDSIQGGLYDATLSSVIQIDVLLALLAEAGELLGRQEERTDVATVFSMRQLMTLLQAIEDVQTVHARVRAKTEDCFRACIDARWDAGSAATSSRLDPSDLLRKSVSGLTDSSGFSLVGSEITTASSLSSNKGGSGAKTVNGGKRNGGKDTAGVIRAWDWRDRWHPAATGDELLMDLRTKIAAEIAAIWIEDA